MSRGLPAEDAGSRYSQSGQIGLVRARLEMQVDRINTVFPITFTGAIPCIGDFCVEGTLKAIDVHT